MLVSVGPRGALYLMPSMAVLATAVLVLGPGRERPAVGVRVWGVPAAGATAAVWRVETIERQFGSDQMIAIEGLELSVTQGPREIAAWHGASAGDGVVEAAIQAAEPFAGSLGVRVSRGNVALAQGEIAMRPAAALVFERRGAEGSAKGPVALRVEIGRGVLASPFPGTLLVRATREGKAAGGVVLRPKAEGAQVFETGLLPATDANGEATLHVQPTWHSVELQIEAADPRVDPPEKSTWDGSLPVKPGALWVSFDAAQRPVVPPAPRDRAYVSGLGDQGRVFGAVVPLVKSASGLFEGALPGEELARLGVRAVTVAGDAQELGGGTVTWPLDGTDAVAAAPRVELLLDGVPLAERLEKKRAGSARLASVGVALVAGLFEAVLLVLYSRASQAKLAAHLAQASEGTEELAAASRMTASPSTRLFTLVVAVGLVVLAFGAVAAFAIVR
jgi:hypothetical protein